MLPTSYKFILPLQYLFAGNFNSQKLFENDNQIKGEGGERRSPPSPSPTHDYHSYLNYFEYFNGLTKYLLS